MFLSLLDMYVFVAVVGFGKCLAVVSSDMPAPSSQVLQLHLRCFAAFTHGLALLLFDFSYFISDSFHCP